MALWAAAGEDIETKTIDELYGSEQAGTVEPASTNLVRPLGVMLLLAGIAGGLYVLARRVSPRRFRRGGRNLSVLETAYLSPKHTVALVRVRNRVLLLGLGQDIRTLAAFEHPDEVMAFDGDFSRELTEALETDEEDRAAPPSPLDPYRRQINRLRGAVGKWRERLRAGSPGEGDA